MHNLFFPGNVLLHEWGHLRWGLGDEYPHRERGESEFYLGPKASWANPNSGAPAVPVRCSEAVGGTIKGKISVATSINIYFQKQNITRSPILIHLVMFS